MRVLSRIVPVPALAGLLIVAGGCATAHRFEVDAIKNPHAPPGGNAFCVVSGNPELGEQDLRFQEAATLVTRALSSQGMYRVADATNADVVVEVDFGVDGPIHKLVVYTEPAPLADDVHPWEMPSHPLIPSRHLPGQVDAQATLEPFATENEPRIMLRVETEYEVFLRVSARQVEKQAEPHPPREAWSVYVRGRTEKDDVRRSLPLLVAAAMDNVGRNAPGPVMVTIGDDDPRVTFVKRPM